MNRKVYSLAICTGLFGLLSQGASAEFLDGSSFSCWLQSHFIAAVSAGPTWASGGREQTLFLTPDIEKTYTTNHASRTLGEGELFLGLQQEIADNLGAEYGFAIGAASETRLSGNIWDDASPEFNNYTYRYHLQHSQVVVKGKLLADLGYIVKPWVGASLGVGFNKASDFTNSPIIYEAVAMPNFSSLTTTAFTYAISLGLEYQLSPRWQAGVGYEYADWGESNLGRAPGQTSSSGLTLSHYYTNGLLFNLTFN